MICVKAGAVAVPHHDRHRLIGRPPESVTGKE